MADQGRLVHALGRIGDRIAGGDDLSTTLDGVLHAMGEAIGADRCSIMLKSGGGHLRIRAARGLPGHVVERTLVALGAGIAGQVAEDGAARLLRDAGARREAWRSSSVYACASALCVPLRAHGEVLGVVNLANKRDAAGTPAEFDEGDLQAASVLASQAALAIAAAEVSEMRREHARLEATLTSLQEHVLGLESRAGALAVIRQVTDSMTARGTLDEVLEGIGRGTTRLLGARRGSLMLRASGSRLLRMQAAVGIPQKVVEKSRTELGLGIAGRCAESGEPVLIRDIDDVRGRIPGAGERRDEYRSPSAICVPLRLRGEVLGVLNINDPEDGKAFGDDDLFVAQIVANQAAVAIWNGQLRDAAVAAAEAHRALDVARGIQQSFVPPDLALPGVEVAARSIACAGAGGDYVDFWVRRDADGCGTGELVLVIGDVSGHGVGAALLMATTRAFVRALLSASRDLPAVMGRLNDLIARDVREGRFVTLFLGLLDPARGTLTWSSAGHDPPLHHRSGEGATAALEATGPPLGVVSDALFPSAVTALAPGDLLVLTTDGVWEMRNEAGEMFGRERLARALGELAAEPPRGVLAGLRRRVGAFAGNVDPHDDISLVVARVRTVA